MNPQRVLVTRARHDAAGLARSLVHAGFDPVLVPLIELRWDPFAVADAATKHPGAHHLLVTSAVAADVIALAAPNGWRTARWSAIGPGTADRLGRHGWTASLVPERSTGADLVRALGDLTGQVVVIPRSELGNPALIAQLGEAGATVHEVVAYTNVAPVGYEAHLRAALPVHATTLTSGSAAERLAEAIPAQDHALLGQIIVIGPSTAEVARQRGLPVHAVADPHTVSGLMDAVWTALTPR